jgi:cytochrome c553
MLTTVTEIIVFHSWGAVGHCHRYRHRYRPMHCAEEAMNTMTFVAVACLAAATAIPVFADDFEALKPGEAIAINAGRTVMEKKCQYCHGKNGIAKSVLPNIAGQKLGYLVRSLRAFKTRERKNPTMELVVESLSDEDIANVAAYYAAIKITVEVPQ